MLDTYENLIQDLKKLLDFPPSSSQEEHGKPRLLNLDGVDLQLEMDEEQENLIISVVIAEIPTGSFEFNLFKLILQTNLYNFLSSGYCGFHEASRTVIMFERLPLDSADPRFILELIPLLAQKAKNWQIDLKSGKTPKLEKDVVPVESQENLFGLQR